MANIDHIHAHNERRGTLANYDSPEGAYRCEKETSGEEAAIGLRNEIIVTRQLARIQAEGGMQ